MQWVQDIDMGMLNAIREHLAGNWMDRFMVLVTSLGDRGLIWICTAALLLFFRKTRPYAVWVLFALWLAYVLGDHIIKPLAGRIRPCNLYPDIEVLIRRPRGFSFPSGHTGSSFAAATILCFADKKIGIAAVILASLIAFSRLYLFVHYPSDIAGGILLGTGCGLLTILLCRQALKAGSPELHG